MDRCAEEDSVSDEEQNTKGAFSVNDDPAVRVLTPDAKGAVKNLFIISFSFFLYFTGFSSLANLQSTMNAEGGMGPDSQAVIYLCSMLSCFFSQLMIEKFGAKITFLVSVLFSCPYIAANFHLQWDTMMTTSVLYGLFSGPLNAAMILYLDEMATRYKASVDESKENVKALFFGFNVFFGESTQVVGNAISYYVLDAGKHVHVRSNSSFYNECGVYFSPANRYENNTNLIPPTKSERLSLTGIFLLLGILAVVTAFFLDPLKNDVKDIRGCQRATKTFFSAAFIACSWGVHHVGFVTICFGVCGALMAIAIGPLVKCVSQMSVILLAAVMNVTTCALLFVWQPSPDAPIDYFAFAGVWGMTDAIWWSQVAALYGLMFPNDREAAFSNFFFWSFLGYFLSYSYANYFTVAVKINIMLVFLIVGISLYVIGQIKIKCLSSRSGYVAIGDSE